MEALMAAADDDAVSESSGDYETVSSGEDEDEDDWAPRDAYWSLLWTPEELASGDRDVVFAQPPEEDFRLFDLEDNLRVFRGSASETAHHQTQDALSSSGNTMALMTRSSVSLFAELVRCGSSWASPRRARPLCPLTARSRAAGAPERTRRRLQRRPTARMLRQRCAASRCP